VLVAAGVLALGFAFAVGTWLLPDAPSYARVGTRLFPGLISSGLVIVGALLLREALTSGFSAFPDEHRDRFDLRAVAWISSGVVLHMLLIAGLGFILCSSFLFVAVARGFGSTKPMRDIGLGLAISIVVYVLFTQALTLSLPWGAWLPELS
jgi:putative tricarboxylic transport membrane protein